MWVDQMFRITKSAGIGLILAVTLGSSLITKADERSDFAKQIIKQAKWNDKDYACKPVSWFSSFSSGTRMALTPSIVVFYNANSSDHSFKKLYHMFTRDSETKGKIMGSGYYPGLGRVLGSYILEEVGMSCCDLTVILDTAKKTEFNCGWDTMIN